VVFLLLAAALSSAKAAGLVLLNLPLSLIGGIAAIYLAESPSLAGNTLALLGLGSGPYTAPVLSIATLVGFITLFGIAVRNGILLINQYQSHAEDGRPLHQAILHGSQERLVAILMTALCAAIGLIPLALRAGQPGAEILAPLAIVVLGGLASSTVLNLVVVPAAYAWVFARHERPHGTALDDTPSAPGHPAATPRPQETP
jgi:Cu/Ag efflux pump CusA